MRPKNKHISGSPEELARLMQEYRMLGFYVRRTSAGITVFALPPKKRTKKRKRRVRN
jgi:hypothetical protein